MFLKTEIIMEKSEQLSVGEFSVLLELIRKGHGDDSFITAKTAGPNSLEEAVIITIGSTIGEGEISEWPEMR